MASYIKPLDWLNMTFCVGLFIHGVCVINLMTRKTPFVRRLGYSIFTVGVFASIMGPIYGMHHASPVDVLVSSGLLVYHIHMSVRRGISMLRGWVLPWLK